MINYRGSIKIVAKYSAVTKQYEIRANKEKATMPFNYNTLFWEDDYERLVNRLNSGIYSSIEADFLR